MHSAEHLRGAERPSLLQEQIINILHPKAGQLAEYVHGIQEFLQVDQPDLERQTLPLHNLT